MSRLTRGLKITTNDIAWNRLLNDMVDQFRLVNLSLHSRIGVSLLLELLVWDISEPVRFSHRLESLFYSLLTLSHLGVQLFSIGILAKPAGDASKNIYEARVELRIVVEYVSLVETFSRKCLILGLVRLW